MRIFFILALLVATALAKVRYKGGVSRRAAYEHPLMKRWYGVQPITEDTDTSEDGMPNIYPWPETCSNPSHRPVRYCFKDARSAKNLQPIVEAANVKWAQATRITALSIELAAGCGGDPTVLCSDDRLKGERDALVISDETRDDDPKWNEGEKCVTSTTIGYKHADKHIPYRHTLKFCDLQLLKGDQDDAIRDMTHELGHAIGFQHEHQRPDRDKYLVFQPKNLDGYAQAKALARADPEDLFEENDRTTFKMHAVTSDYMFAKYYFPGVIDHLKGDAFEDSSLKEGLDVSVWDTYQYSTDFDYNSIMMYDGDLGSKEGKAVLVRKDNGEKVWMGGGVNTDVDKTLISVGDLARVAMLYDNGTPDCQLAKQGLYAGGPGGNWSPIGVKTRDMKDWIDVPPPRGWDET